jgi:hypothetical protein
MTDAEIQEAIVVLKRWLCTDKPLDPSDSAFIDRLNSGDKGLNHAILSDPDLTDALNNLGFYDQ